ncbi:MAG: DegV family protein [Oscillospiraceae bacterium]|jgi:DegV family protein with EDD domain|nr:DegV family protein [Oscillospiraceae bacterium]
MHLKKDKIRLITDSGCDIPEGWENTYNIDIIPFNIMIDDKEYWERADLKPQQFYELARNYSGIPKTNQILPFRIEERFLECVQRGTEDVIFVTINGSGSQTYNNAVQARDSLEKAGKLGGMKIHIVDSHCYSVGYGYPVVEAAKKIKAGQSAESIVAYLEDWFSCCEIYLLTFDLRHAKKSGRITAAASVVGELMGIRPVISMIDDKTAIIKKARGEKAAVDEAVKIAAERMIPGTPWIVLRTTCTEMEDYTIAEMTKRTGKPPVMESYSGAAVGSNAGTKFLGMVVKGQSRR